jgi:putative ABC transport system permease protein
MTPPPAFSTRVLAWASRRLGTPDLPADAADLFATYTASQGHLQATRWYRAQARAAVMRVVTSAATHVVTGIRSPAAGLSLDARLGVRMLRRYPGLTVIGGLAMAFAIFVGSALFEFIKQTLPDRALPIPHGEQVVGLRLWNRDANRPQPPEVDDVRHWTTHLTSVELIGAFATSTLTIETSTGAAAQVQAARMSPSGFRIAGVSPLMGRVFTEEDVVPGAPPVAVIGAATWRALFDARTDVTGQQITIGDTVATVIGVMPDGFKFPVNHGFWMPLDLREPPVGGLRGFGRLRQGSSIEQAEAELVSLGRGVTRSAAGAPVLWPTIQWYRESMFDVPITVLLVTMVQQLNVFSTLFLLLVASNVALLMFARAAARERELVVRSALGASRRRIVVQFLMEALTLFGGAALIGLAAAGPGLAWIERQIAIMGGGTSPFWFNPSVSFETIVYATLLTIIAALTAGGLPALRATRQLSTSRLQEATAGAGRLRLGGIWTAVIVIQVTATVVFTAGAGLMWRQAHRSGALDATFRASEYIAVTLESDPAVPGPARFERIESLVTFLSRQPGIAGAAVGQRLPLMTQGSHIIEVEGRATHEISMPQIGLGFFETFRSPVVAGRDFSAGDQRAPANPVIVDAAFVAEALDGESALGRRVRVVDPSGQTPPGDWLDIVGVVPNLQAHRTGALVLDNQLRPFVYRPLSASAPPSIVTVAVHVPTATAASQRQVRQATTRAAAGLTVLDVQALDQVVSAEAAFWQLWARLLLMVSVVALVLALAGIYAVMSFTVTRRTREIGIRMALGARSGRVALEVLRHPLRQVAAGLTAGCVVVLALFVWVRGGVSPTELALLSAFGLVLAVVCLLACLGPAHRAISVHPSRSLGSGE